MSQAMERLRLTYRPSNIRLLFVGESAPAGGTFFYAANSTLYFETRAAFMAVFSEALLAGRTFLDLFRDLGCYLDDLCLEPVNHLGDPVRRQMRADAEPSLADRLQTYAASMTVAIGKTTAAPHVAAALERAGMRDQPFRAVSFPGRPSHRVDFHGSMVRILSEAEASGLLVVPG